MPQTSWETPEMKLAELIAIKSPTAEERLQQAKAISEGMRALSPSMFSQAERSVRQRVATLEKIGIFGRVPTEH